MAPGTVHYPLLASLFSEVLTAGDSVTCNGVERVLNPLSCQEKEACIFPRTLQCQG